MRVLLVAPRTNLLLVDEEVEAVIRSGLKVTPMMGKVNRMEIVKELRANEYDILWLATHGEASGVHLSDGLWPADDMVTQCRGRFRLVFINTCSSFKLARRIQEQANITTVGTIISIPDVAAYETGSLFARAIAAGMPFGKAYGDSVSGNADDRMYVYLAALEATQDSIDSLVLRVDELMLVYRRLFWISAALHVPEWIAIVWLMMQVQGGK